MTWPLTASALIDKRIRAAGVFSIVNLEGTKVSFYPRVNGKCRLPADIEADLSANDGRLLMQLRDFLVSQARIAQH